MYPTSRRQLLQLSAVGVAGGLAGCSSLGASSPSSERDEQNVGAISVFNDRQDDVTISLLVARDGEQLYWQTHDLAGEESETGRPETLTIAPPTYEAGRGAYLVGVRIQNSDESRVFDVDELLTDTSDENGCYWISVTLFENAMGFARNTKDEGITNCNPTSTTTGTET